MANPLGIAIGSVLPAILVEADINDPTIINGFDLLMIIELVYALFGITAIIFVKNEPITPPSASSSHQIDNKKEYNSLMEVFIDMKNDIIMCFKNKNFIIIFISFGLGLGVFNALTTLSEQLIKPFCYNEDDAALGKEY